MEIEVKRFAPRKNYTIGRLYINRAYQCNTMEPCDRFLTESTPSRKLKGKTAIPTGRYPVIINWSPRFEKWLPLLLHVPLFSGIRLHAGNLPSQTEGCIMPGENTEVGVITSSARWLVNIKKAIVEAKGRGEGIFLTVSRTYTTAACKEWLSGDKQKQSTEE